MSLPEPVVLGGRRRELGRLPRAAMDAVRDVTDRDLVGGALRPEASPHLAGDPAVQSRHGVGAARHAERERRQPERPLVGRSEEHTSELQSLAYLVCRLLLEKKKKK